MFSKRIFANSDERNIKQLFLKYKSKLIKRFGKKALYDDQINDLCLNLFGNKWNGVHAQDRVILKTGYQIINTDLNTGKGIHWVALYITPKTCYIYDSYGRNSRTLLPHLLKKLKNLNVKWKDSDRDMEQIGYTSEVCGHLCIAWLMVTKELGILSSMKI